MLRGVLFCSVRILYTFFVYTVDVGHDTCSATHEWQRDRTERSCVMAFVSLYTRCSIPSFHLDCSLFITKLRMAFFAVFYHHIHDYNFRFFSPSLLPLFSSFRSQKNTDKNWMRYVENLSSDNGHLQFALIFSPASIRSPQSARTWRERGEGKNWK